ncbi:MAG: hypothetical protein R2801_08690 [Chitinophagales bacterium]
MNQSKFISLLLILSAINLTLMIPGGGIDTRNFSQIAPLYLSAFNIFLTTLGFVSIFLPYFVVKNQRWSLLIAFICGLSYCLVYVFDFAHIFPKSPDRMPKLLLILEAFGIILSLPLMFYAIKKYSTIKNDQDKIQLSRTIYWLIFIAVLIGIAIIVFATKSAMTGE